MNIQQDIKAFLKFSGWNPLRLAQEAKVSKDVIYRLIRGERKGVHSSTLTKLWPFLYGKRDVTRPQSENRNP